MLLMWFIPRNYSLSTLQCRVCNSSWPRGQYRWWLIISTEAIILRELIIFIYFRTLFIRLWCMVTLGWQNIFSPLCNFLFFFFITLSLDHFFSTWLHLSESEDLATKEKQTWNRHRRCIHYIPIQKNTAEERHRGWWTWKRGEALCE